MRGALLRTSAREFAELHGYIRPGRVPQCPKPREQTQAKWFAVIELRGLSLLQKASMFQTLSGLPLSRGRGGLQCASTYVDGTWNVVTQIGRGRPVCPSTW